MRERIVNRRKEIIMIALMFIGSVMIWNGLKVEHDNVMNRIVASHIKSNSIDKTTGLYKLDREWDEAYISGREPYTWNLDEMKRSAIEIVAGIAIFAFGYGCTTRKIEILKVTKKEAE